MMAASLRKAVENLGPAVNGPSGEWNVLVAPDETFIIFESSGRSGNLGAGGDLYLSYRNGPQWEPPIHLSAISTPGSDLQPRISPDQSRLYFATAFTADGSHTDIVSVPLPALLAHYPRRQNIR